MKFKDTAKAPCYLLKNTKYRVLIQSVVILFVALFILVLINLFIAHRSTKSTEHMDIIGNISDLTLEIAIGAQHLALVDASDSQANQQIVERLQQKANQVDQYMHKLAQYDQQEQAMEKFSHIWQNYRQKIQQLSNHDAQDRLDLADYAYIEQPMIGKLITYGYNTYLTDTYNMARYSRYLQLASFLGLIGYFVFFVKYTMRQMQRDDFAIAKAQSEMQDIMNTVKEGLFLIDSHFVIGDNYSQKLEKILGRKNLAGITLPNLLENIVSVADIDATKKFIHYLYASNVDEALIQDANPLKQVQITFIDENGMAHTRYLHFDFLRVVHPHNQKIIKVFVSVVDITETTNLKLQMQKDKAAYHEYITKTGYLLSLDKALVGAFILQNKACIDQIEDTLNTPVFDKPSLIKKIKTLIIQTDTLKYESSTLGISQFQDSAKHLADELKRLARMSDIHGQSFTAFSTELAHYQNMLALTEQFINQPTWQLENLSSTQYS